MPYYAAENHLSTDPIEGGIEISYEQYMAGIQALTVDGFAVNIIGGFHIVQPIPCDPGGDGSNPPEPQPLPTTKIGARRLLIGVGAQIMTDDQVNSMFNLAGIPD